MIAVSFPGPNPLDPSVHFDLGVDVLASSAELEEMADPWSPTDAAVPPPVTPHPMPAPEQDLSPWASDLQIPGL